MSPRAVVISWALPWLLLGCAEPRVVELAVSPPRVWGDDHVLRSLAERARGLGALARGARGSEVQEARSRRQESVTRSTFQLDLSDPLASLPSPPSLEEPRPLASGWFLPTWLRPIPGRSWGESFRALVDRVDQVRAAEDLCVGDERFLAPRARSLLLRFDLVLPGYLELGDRRRFLLVEVEVSPKPGTPVPEVYFLLPAWSAIGTEESFLASEEDQLALELLGSWGGLGLGGGYAASERTRERLEAFLEAPLQFGIPGAPQPGLVRYAFALGPRRRIEERTWPGSWLRGKYRTSYELQPGPRICQAVLLFPEGGRGRIELLVRVLADGRLLRADEVRLGAATRELGRYQVAAPAAQPGVPPELVIDPEQGGALILDAGQAEVAFSARSEVVLGGLLLPVRLLGRGRLLVLVPPLAQKEATELQGRVLTADQPDFFFRVRCRREGTR